MDPTDRKRYRYPLPPELIAQVPAPVRSQSRALIAQRGQASWQETTFDQITHHLHGDEALVVNDTRVIPARIAARRATGAKIEVFLLRPLDETRRWHAWVSPARKVRVGEALETRAGTIELLDREDRFWTVEIPDVPLDQIGETPLPPYIKRDPSPHSLTPHDRDRYQTIFARQPGAVAAPTAGLHFDEALQQTVRERGIPIIPVTLHVGPGTFAPIASEDLRQHRVDPELYEVSESARTELSRARESGRRLVCVGTTSLRLLETLPELDAGPKLVGQTDLTILPGYEFRHADGLITNFHLPESSLLVLVCTFHGYDQTMQGYRLAVERRFRFYSYGDAMLILPPRG